MRSLIEPLTSEEQEQADATMRWLRRLNELVTLHGEVAIEMRPTAATSIAFPPKRFVWSGAEWVEV